MHGHGKTTGAQGVGDGGSMIAHHILRLPSVKAVTGLSRSTIYSRIAEGRFPAPIALGGRAIGWLESEIQRWIEERIQESRHDSQ